MKLFESNTFFVDMNRWEYHYDIHYGSCDIPSQNLPFT